MQLPLSSNALNACIKTPTKREQIPWFHEALGMLLLRVPLPHPKWMTAIGLKTKWASLSYSVTNSRRSHVSSMPSQAWHSMCVHFCHTVITLLSSRFTDSGIQHQQPTQDTCGSDDCLGATGARLCDSKHRLPGQGNDQ